MYYAKKRGGGKHMDRVTNVDSFEMVRAGGVIATWFWTRQRCRTTEHNSVRDYINVSL